MLKLLTSVWVINIATNIYISIHNRKHINCITWMSVLALLHNGINLPGVLTHDATIFLTNKWEMRAVCLPLPKWQGIIFLPCPPGVFLCLSVSRIILLSCITVDPNFPLSNLIALGWLFYRYWGIGDWTLTNLSVFGGRRVFQVLTTLNPNSKSYRLNRDIILKTLWVKQRSHSLAH